MMRTISRGLSNIEELKKIKIKEAIRIGISRSKMPLIYPSSNIGEPSVPIVDWSSIPSISPFSLGLFADLRIPDTIETPPDIRSNS